MSIFMNWMNILSVILASLTVGLIAGLVKAYSDINVLKSEINRLDKAHCVHEDHNNSSFARIENKLDEIYMILIKNYKD